MLTIEQRLEHLEDEAAIRVGIPDDGERRSGMQPNAIPG
jgi:hypothetical protein